MREGAASTGSKLGAHVMAELAFWAALALVGLYVAWRGSFFGHQLGYSIVGPAAFPIGIGICLFLICGAVAVSVYHRHAAKLAEPVAWKPFLIILGLFALYLVLLGRIGFVISTPLFYTAVARTLGSKRTWLDLVVGILLAAVIFVCFRDGLGVRMPTSGLWYTLFGIRI